MNEYILCAAIKTRLYNQPIICGYRHNDIFKSLKELNVKREHVIGAEQGFLTSKNRFVDREEARHIAYKAKQCATPEGLLLKHHLIKEVPADDEFKARWDSDTMFVSTLEDESE